MMLRWGFRTLIMQKGATLGSIAGLALSFLLALFFAAVWQGETDQIVAYPQKLKPDLWVMQKGVSNMHMVTSFLWDWKAEVIEQMPEVDRVTPFLYLNTVVVVKEHKIFGFVVGLFSKDSPAGPWSISRGRHLRSVDEIVVPEPMASIYDVQLGDTVLVVDRDYRVVGFSKGVYSSANPVFFVLREQLQNSLSSAGTHSYLLVDTGPETDVEALRRKIIREIDKVNVLTNEQFIANDYAMAKQMGAETILIMTLICGGLAALIIGYSSYTLVLRKRKEIAIIKAVGGKSGHLLVTLILQSIVVTVIAYGLALLLLITFDYAAETLAPQITLQLSRSLVLQPAVLAIGVAVAGSLYPAIKLIKLDPATAYQEG
jgi:putative ABC transport system permease protein